jgi:hypothetical protein
LLRIFSSSAGGCDSTIQVQCDMMMITFFFLAETKYRCRAPYIPLCHSDSLTSASVEEGIRALTMLLVDTPLSLVSIPVDVGECAVAMLPVVVVIALVRCSAGPAGFH